MATESVKEMLHRIVYESMEKETYKTIAGALYKYDRVKGVYCNNAEPDLRREAQVSLGKDGSIHNIGEVVGRIKVATIVDASMFDCDKSSLCVLNGVLDLDTRELRPHSPDELFLRQLSVNYDPHARCPIISKFLGEIVNSGDAKRLKQFLGFMLMPGYIYHKSFVLVGSGDNGKTTFLNLAQKFIGEGHYSSLTLQQISGEKFMLPRLFGKIANIAPEMGSTAIRDTEMLKTVTGESSFEVQNKGEKPFNMTNSAKMIFACNEIPAAPGADEAYYGRWIIIPFPNKFPKGDPRRDEHLLEKMTTEEELSGLLNIALDGRESLLSEKGFDYPLDYAGVRTIYQAWCGDTIQQFAATRLAVDDGAVITKQELLSEYAKFCGSLNKFPESEKKFFQELPKAVGGHMITVHTSQDGGRVWAVRGLRMAKSGDVTAPYVSIKPCDFTEDDQ